MSASACSTLLWQPVATSSTTTLMAIRIARTYTTTRRAWSALLVELVQAVGQLLRHVRHLLVFFGGPRRARRHRGGPRGHRRHDPLAARRVEAGAHPGPELAHLRDGVGGLARSAGTALAAAALLQLGLDLIHLALAARADNEHPHDP